MHLTYRNNTSSKTRKKSEKWKKSDTVRTFLSQLEPWFVSQMSTNRNYAEGALRPLRVLEEVLFLYVKCIIYGDDKHVKNSNLIH